MTILTPPQIQRNSLKQKNLFLAGSIEMGQACDWQTQVIDNLRDLDITIFNPRRANWDSTWEQTQENPQFFQQVTWELQMLERSDLILMYFAPNTKSPISLLELGLYANTGKIICCCPDEFWRKGNVDIVCHMYGVPLFDDLGKALKCVKGRL